MATNFGTTSTTGTPPRSGQSSPNFPQGGTTTKPEERREGKVARTIEHETSKLPSDWFLWAGLGAIAVSALLQVSNKKETGNFIGQWAPTLLIMGLYNKLVKIAGSDAIENQQQNRESMKY